jgi:hypothetical protein
VGGRYAEAFHGADGAGGHVHAADAAVPCVADQHVAIGQHGEIVRAVELGEEGRAAVAGIARRAEARDMSEDPAGVHLEQPVARIHLDDEHVSGRIEFRAVGLDEPRLGGGDAGARFRAASHEDEFGGVQRHEAEDTDEQRGAQEWAG